jgi:phosphoglycolate phosphatase
MALRAILFDKDGTLVDYQATWGAATYAVMARMADGDEAKIAELAAASHYDIATRQVLPTSPLVASSSADYGVTWAEILGQVADSAFLRRMDQLFVQEGLGRVAPIGDPVGLLRTLREQGLALGVITNDSEAGAKAQCDHLGITPLLDAVIGYDSGHGRKPECGQILAFSGKHGIPPAETALVGDSLHDLHAARAAGVIAVAVLSGLAGEDELAAHADHVLDDIMALPDLIARL